MYCGLRKTSSAVRRPARRTPSAPAFSMEKAEACRPLLVGPLAQARLSAVLHLSTQTCSWPARRRALLLANDAFCRMNADQCFQASQLGFGRSKQSIRCPCAVPGSDWGGQLRRGLLKGCQHGQCSGIMGYQSKSRRNAPTLCGLPAPGTIGRHGKRCRSAEGAVSCGRSDLH